MNAWAGLLMPPLAALLFWSLAGSLPAGHVLALILSGVGHAFFFLLWPVTAFLAVRTIVRGAGSAAG